MNWLPIAIVLWIFGAGIVAMSDTKYHKRWALGVFLPGAIILIPLIGIYYGPLMLLLSLAGVGSVLRWPFYYIGKFIWAKATGGEFRGPDWRPENHNKVKVRDE